MLQVGSLTLYPPALQNVAQGRLNLKDRRFPIEYLHDLNKEFVHQNQIVATFFPKAVSLLFQAFVLLDPYNARHFFGGDILPAIVAF